MQLTSYLADQSFCWFTALNRFGEQGPSAVEPALGSGDTLAVPGSPQVPAGKKHQVAPHGISAVFPDQLIRGNHVSPGFGHFFSVLTQNHTLVAQLSHGLVPFGNAHIPQGFMEKPSVNQMHVGVLNTSGVNVHRHPVIVFLLVKRPFGIGRAEIAQVVPGGAHESIHSVGFPGGFFPAVGTDGVLPGGMQLKWAFSGRQPFNLIRQ